ncbi:MAG: ThiF family adenylyltransferase [Proteobacteria bacterium]|nr:ThiF family adenylyltransferase [Pseudomonadota bacterium]
MTAAVDDAAAVHLLRPDGQEDLAFALWRPSTGAERTSALIQELILPRPGDRHVRGNVSFAPQYLERALSMAAAQSSGLALMHSHPAGHGWQEMSDDDVAAEQGNAAAVAGASGLPFVGLTLAGDRTWSARFWERTAPRTYPQHWCGTVRVIGDALRMSFNPVQFSRPASNPQLARTVSAWGEDAQSIVSRLRIGVVGAGSVGGFVAEALARMGVRRVEVIDFDVVEEVNLDRLCYATARDVGKAKAPLLATRLKDIATADGFVATPLNAAVYETAGFRKALDCDVLVACVDRPWGRYVLNMIAAAHLIPVVDGGIAARQNRLGQLASADWRAHTVGPGRACLECLGQYDAAAVQLEREGYLDDPTYISNLPAGHTLKARENVFTFAMSCASFQLMQLLSLVVDPLGRANVGPQLYHFVGGYLEPPSHPDCRQDCIFRSFLALGDHVPVEVTGDRPGGAANEAQPQTGSGC